MHLSRGKTGLGRILSTTALALAVATTAACGTGSSGSGAADASGPIKVGLLYTDDNPIGTAPEVRDAGLAAVSWINDNGGIGGRQVEAIPCNGKNNPESDVQCATQWINQGAVTVVGLDGLWGGNGVSLVERAGIINQTLPLSGPEFNGKTSFPFNGMTTTAGLAAAEYAAGQGHKTAACISPDIATLKQACTDFFAGPAKKEGITDVEIIAIPPNVTDVSQYVSKAAQAGAAVVYSASSKPLNLRLVQAAGQLGFKPQWIFPGDTGTPDFIKTAGASAGGLIFWFDNKLWTDMSDPDAKVFADAMKKYQPNTVISSNASNVFSVLMTLKRLGDQIGGDKMTREGLATALPKVSGLQQFMGPMLDASKHLPNLPQAYHTGAYLYQWNGTGFSPVGQGYFAAS